MEEDWHLRVTLRLCSPHMTSNFGTLYSYTINQLIQFGLGNKPLHISFHRFGSGTVVTTAITTIDSTNERPDKHHENTFDTKIQLVIAGNNGN